MKKFIYKILIFTLPFIFFGYILDIFISENLKKSNSHAQGEFPTWNAIIDGKLNSNVLIYGSSRAWVHFDPKIIKEKLNETAYNLGIDGYTFHMQYLRHILALKNNPKPKLIIHSVDAGTLKKGNLYNSNQFLPYMLWNKTFYEYISKYDGYSYLDDKIPLKRYFGKDDVIYTSIKMFVSTQNNTIQRIRGYQGLDRTWNKDFENAKKKMNKYHVKFDDSTLVLFDKYLKECKAKNIKVILVYAPIYIEGQEFIENQYEIIKTYKVFAEKYGFIFLDFSNDAICLDKKYFCNATHLNKTGAEIFTIKLCNQIKIANINNIK